MTLRYIAILVVFHLVIGCADRDEIESNRFFSEGGPHTEAQKEIIKELDGALRTKRKKLGKSLQTIMLSYQQRDCHSAQTLKNNDINFQFENDSPNKWVPLNPFPYRKFDVIETDQQGQLLYPLKYPNDGHFDDDGDEGTRFDFETDNLEQFIFVTIKKGTRDGNMNDGKRRYRTQSIHKMTIHGKNNKDPGQKGLIQFQELIRLCPEGSLAPFDFLSADLN